MNLPGLPEHGKMVVLHPETAVAAVAVSPEHGNRVFTALGIAKNQALVVDMDKMNEILSAERIDDVG